MKMEEKEVSIKNGDNAVINNSIENLGEKKRRNRWGEEKNVENQKVITINNEELILSGENNTEKIRKRKSRWSSETDEDTTGKVDNKQSNFSSEPPQETAQQTLILKIQLNQVNEKLMTFVEDAKRIDQDPNRSPSPPPKYDITGKRTNLREARMRESLLEQRTKLIEEIMKLNPQYTGGAGLVVTGKPVKRIFFPKDLNPLLNFVGLIIGPRGVTQKKLEQETGCKISIRGKGACKDGSRSRAIKQIDEDMELHCHITGENEFQVEKAAKMVHELLHPTEEQIHMYKQVQLRELAIINGTLKEDDYCPICGEKGHLQFECPHRSKAFKAAAVKCSICGDLSHPTRDCPLKANPPSSENALDTEYDSFMMELGEKPSKVNIVPKPSPNAITSNTLSTADPSKTSTGGAGTAGKSNQTMMQPIVDLLARQQAAHPLVPPTAMAAPILYNHPSNIQQYAPYMGYIPPPPPY